MSEGHDHAVHAHEHEHDHHHDHEHDDHHGHEHDHHHDHGHSHSHGHNHDHNESDCADCNKPKLVTAEDVKDIATPEWKKKALALAAATNKNTNSSENDTKSSNDDGTTSGAGFIPFGGTSWHTEVSTSATRVVETVNDGENNRTSNNENSPESSSQLHSHETNSKNESKHRTDTKQTSSFAIPRRNKNSILHAHFDCFSGAAGDMMLASCLDASPDPMTLLNLIQSNIECGMPELKGEFNIEMERVWKGGMGSIAATKINVHSIYDHKPAPVPTVHTEEKLKNKNMENKHSDEHGHHHEHEHGHKHGHEHGHKHGHDHGHEHVYEHGHHHKHDHNHEHGHHHNHEHNHEHGHHKNHQHDHAKEHVHDHNHDHGHDHSHEGPLRNLPQIKEMLTKSSPRHIPPRVRDLAIQTFTELAIAESFTHGTSSPSTVHFHEVGAIDSIVDVVGTLLALHHLNVDSVSCSRIPVGEGMVWTDHGQLPVPAFATMRLLIGMKTCKGPGSDGMTGELVTPTAASLLRVLTGVADIERMRSAGDYSKGGNDDDQTAFDEGRVGRPPNFTPRAVGIGGGTKEFVKHPNITRVIIGDDVLDPLALKGAKRNVKNHSAGAHSLFSLDKDITESTILPISNNDPLPTENQATSDVNGEHSISSGTIISGKISKEKQLIDISDKWKVDTLTLLQANIDDTTAEILSYTIDLLLKNGAIDAWVQPIVMKKGRSAHMLNCLFHSSTGGVTSGNPDSDGKIIPTCGDFLEIIFRHTTTLGVRIQRDIERAALHRRVIQVQTIYGLNDEEARSGIVDVKLGILGTEIVSTKAEFDHCKVISERTGVPLKQIADYATKMAHEQLALDK